MIYFRALPTSALLVLFLFFATPILSAAYCQNPGSARASALGGAFAGLADNSDALFYNPAGIAQLESMEILGMMSTMNLDSGRARSLIDSSVSFCWPARHLARNETIGTAGISARVFNFQDYYQESVFGMHYGSRVTQWLALGAGLKYANISYDSNEYALFNAAPPDTASASFLSVDAGALFLPGNAFSFGAAVRDLHTQEPDVRFRDSVSATVAVGGAYRNGAFRAVSDALIQKNNTRFVLGAEYWLRSNSVPLRVSAGTGENEYSIVAIGSGYRGKHIVVDCSYSYSLAGASKSQGTQKVSLGYAFDAPLTVTAKAAKPKEPERQEYTDFDSAEVTIDDPVLKKAADAKLLVNIAISSIREGEYLKSIDMLRQAIELAPDEQRYIDIRARVEFITDYLFFCVGKDKVDVSIRNAVSRYVVEFEPKEALEMFQYSYSLKPGNENLFRLIKALAKEHDITIDNSARTWNLAEQRVYQALDKFRQKKFDECIKLCEEALDLEPTNVTAYKRLGSTFYILGNMERAKENWKKVIELAPNDDDTANIRELLRKIEAENRQKHKR